MEAAAKKIFVDNSEIVTMSYEGIYAETTDWNAV